MFFITNKIYFSFSGVNHYLVDIWRGGHGHILFYFFYLLIRIFFFDPHVYLERSKFCPNQTWVTGFWGLILNTIHLDDLSSNIIFVKGP